eukprot:TRINITY_DN2218_c0_g1_i1.p1 TRINITY_DN2218_c0_g1~~TRINITY_DN2218_c0_g1_i1.p1  ORF type:complete len:752 (+),score=188.33 TRINITY_DN2218_c0_g1_i1:1778-4033(+)
MARPFNYDENWTTLFKGLDLVVKICQNEITDQQITFQAWTAIYHIVYTWCTRPEEKRKEELYKKVADFFAEVVKQEEQKLNSKRGNILLRDYLTRFTNYTSATSKIKNIFAYMHRYWIPSQQSNGDNTIRDIYTLSLLKWRETAYTPMKGKLLEALLDLVTADRNGEQTDKTLLSNMVTAYTSIGVNEDPSFIFYKKEFQDPFVKNTKDYYIKESDQFLQQNGISEYMKKAEKRLSEEEALSVNYLHANTKQDLVRACEEVLIERHMQSLQDAFQSMLRDDKVEDMKRFYGLLARITNGLVNSAETMKKFLKEVGTDIVNKHAKTLTNRNALKDSVALIQELLNLHEKYTTTIKDCFSDHNQFRQAMDEAFTIFVNSKVGAFNMSEILNNYVDGLLKGLEKQSEDQLEERMASTVRIFTYFDDKDIFYASFRKSLSRRLLSKKYNEDAERSFIAKLKQSCGDVYTKKLEGMFNDVKVSEERIPIFQEHAKTLGLDIDLQVSVLNDLYWPLSKSTELNLPKEFAPCKNVFEEYYAKQTEKRKLTWIYTLGSVVMMHPIIDEKKRKRRLELTVSMIQASVLLMFNDATQFKLSEIRDALGVNEEVLKYSIFPLIYSKQRILGNKGAEGAGKPKLPEGETPSADSLQAEDVIVLVPCKPGPRNKLVFPAGQAPDKKTLPKVNEERIIKIELALVRVMKARNTLRQQELIAEATIQLVKWFRADPKLMKKRIENLMERGFMRRDEEDQTLIHYQA